MTLRPAHGVSAVSGATIFCLVALIDHLSVASIARLSITGLRSPQQQLAISLNGESG